jgi:hypothetical protein
MKRLSYLFFFSISASFFACNNQKEIDHAGLNFNAKRKEIGLPLLNSNWKLTNHNQELLQWIASTYSQPSSYFSKLVKLEDGKVIREENQFIGKQKYKTIDGSFDEELFISCRFDEKENFLEWDCKYRGPGFESGKPVSKKEADSLVHKWGISLEK